MSITWVDAFRVAVAVVVVQALVGAVVGGAAFTVSNPAFAFLPFVFLAAVGAYLAYRSYRGTTPHTHGER